jgi:ribokinase
MAPTKDSRSLQHPGPCAPPAPGASDRAPTNAGGQAPDHGAHALRSLRYVTRLVILVFGSINVDIVMRVPRLPVAGETVLGGTYLVAPGGKGANQACAAARAAGATVHVSMIGLVGDDAWADVALSEMRAAGVDLTGVGLGPGGTGCASILVDAAGHNAIAVASGANMAVRADAVPEAALGPDTTLLLQMEVPAAANWTLIRRARARGARIVLNIAPAPEPAGAVPGDCLDAVDVLVMNEVEAAAVRGRPGTPRELASELAARHGLVCVITLGAAGAVAVAASGAFEGAWQIGALAITPLDTTGAGDCFAGALAAALGTGQDLPRALRYASVAAGLSCLAPGAQPSLPGREAIEARLDELPEARRLESDL